jgi:hypothetical protein
MFVNSFEILYVLTLTERSLAYKNILGLGFMLLSFPLISTMTADPRVRFTHGLYVIGVCFLFFSIFLYFKIKLLNKFVYSTTDYEEYSYQRESYQFAGFTFIEDQRHPRGIEGTEYTTDFDVFQTWSIECWLVPLMIIATIFFLRQRNKIKFLLQNIEEPNQVELKPKDGDQK